MNLSVCVPVQMISSPHTEVSIDLNAESGATVRSPVFAGNNITSLIFNLNPAGHGTVTITVLTETRCLLAVHETMLSDCEPFLLKVMYTVRKKGTAEVQFCS